MSKSIFHRSHASLARASRRNLSPSFVVPAAPTQSIPILHQTVSSETAGEESRTPTFTSDEMDDNDVNHDNEVSDDKENQAVAPSSKTSFLSPPHLPTTSTSEVVRQDLSTRGQAQSSSISTNHTTTASNDGFIAPQPLVIRGLSSPPSQISPPSSAVQQSSSNKAASPNAVFTSSPQLLSLASASGNSPPSYPTLSTDSRLVHTQSHALINTQHHPQQHSLHHHQGRSISTSTAPPLTSTALISTSSPPPSTSPSLLRRGGSPLPHPTLRPSYSLTALADAYEQRKQMLSKILDDVDAIAAWNTITAENVRAVAAGARVRVFKARVSLAGVREAAHAMQVGVTDELARVKDVTTKAIASVASAYLKKENAYEDKLASLQEQVAEAQSKLHSMKESQIAALRSLAATVSTIKADHATLTSCLRDTVAQTAEMFCRVSDEFRRLCETHEEGRVREQSLAQSLEETSALLEQSRARERGLLEEKMGEMRAREEAETRHAQTELECSRLRQAVTDRDRDILRSHEEAAALGNTKRTLGERVKQAEGRIGDLKLMLSRMQMQVCRTGMVVGASAAAATGVAGTGGGAGGALPNSTSSSLSSLLPPPPSRSVMTATPRASTSASVSVSCILSTQQDQNSHPNITSSSTNADTGAEGGGGRDGNLKPHAIFSTPTRSRENIMKPSATASSIATTATTTTTQLISKLLKQSPSPSLDAVAAIIYGTENGQTQPSSVPSVKTASVTTAQAGPPQSIADLSSPTPAPPPSSSSSSSSTSASASSVSSLNNAIFATPHARPAPAPPRTAANPVPTHVRSSSTPSYVSVSTPSSLSKMMSLSSSSSSSSSTPSQSSASAPPKRQWWKGLNSSPAPPAVIATAIAINNTNIDSYRQGRRASLPSTMSGSPAASSSSSSSMSLSSSSSSSFSPSSITPVLAATTAQEDPHHSKKRARTSI